MRARTAPDVRSTASSALSTIAGTVAWPWMAAATAFAAVRSRFWLSTWRSVWSM